jgi:hypothetical protein
MPDLATAKLAAKAAADYYKQLIPKIKLSKLVIEEIEFSDETQEYKITLSHPKEEIESFFGSSDKRDYKIFDVKVDTEAHTATVSAMRIRDDL